MKKIIALSLMLFCGVANSAPKWHSSTINYIYPQADGSYVITFDTPSEECTRSDKYHFVRVSRNGMTEEGSNKLLSLALMAATTGKVLNINFDSASEECSINRMYVEF